MKYEKKIEIRNKIFDNNDIHALIKIFEELRTSDKDLIKYIIKFEDESIIEDNSAQILNNQYYERKNCRSIIMHYTSYNQQNTTRIYLQTSNDSGFLDENTLFVSSYNYSWFQSTLGSLKELIDNSRKQHILNHLTQYPFYLFFTIIYVGIMYFASAQIAYNIFDLQNITSQFGNSILIALSFLSTILFILLATILRYFIRWCYPNVELNTSSICQTIRHKVRKYLGWVISGILIPLVLGVIV